MLFNNREQEILKQEELEKRRELEKMRQEHKEHIQKDSQVQEQLRDTFVEPQEKEETPQQETIQEISEEIQHSYQVHQPQQQEERVPKTRQQFEPQQQLQKQEIQEAKQETKQEANIEPEQEIENEETQEQFWDWFLWENQNTGEVQNVVGLWDKAERVSFNVTNNDLFEQEQEQTFKPDVVIDEQNNVGYVPTPTNEQAKIVVEENNSVGFAEENQDQIASFGSEELKEEENENINTSSMFSKDNFVDEKKDTVDPKLLEEAQLNQELKTSVENDKKIISDLENNQVNWSGFVVNPEDISNWNATDFASTNENVVSETIADKESLEEENGNAENNSLFDEKNFPKSTSNMDSTVVDELNTDIINSGVKAGAVAWGALLWGALLGAMNTTTDLPPEETKEQEINTTGIFKDAQQQGIVILTNKEGKPSYQETAESVQSEVVAQTAHRPQQTINTTQQTNTPSSSEELLIEWNTDEQRGGGTWTPVKQQKVDNSLEVIQRMMANISYNVVKSALSISMVVAVLMLMAGIWMAVVDMFYGLSVTWYYTFIFYSFIIGAGIGYVNFQLNKE